jgi:hypothetical protein
MFYYSKLFFSIKVTFIHSFVVYVLELIYLFIRLWFI